MMDINIKALKTINPSSPPKSYKLFGFVEVLIFPQNRNGKLMSTLLFIIFLSSILFVRNIFSTKPSTIKFTDLVTTLKHDLLLVAELEGIFILALYITSLLLFFALASILASGVTYGGRDLFVKELPSRVVKLLKRPFVTWFYIMLLHLGYCLLLIAFLVPYVLFSKPKFILSDCAILVLIEAALFQTYLAVVWNLALIVLKIEEKWDMEGLGKAGQLIKRSKLRGFFLNILFRAFSVAVVYDLNKIGLKAFSGREIIIPLLALNSMSLMRMLWLMVYSNQYYECKETHGEELELQGSMH